MLAHFAYMGPSVRETGQGKALLGILLKFVHHLLLSGRDCYHKDFKSAIAS